MVIPKDWKTYRFDEVADIVNGQIDPKENKYHKLYQIGSDSIQAGTGKIIDLKRVEDKQIISGNYLFDESMIVYSKIRPNLNKVCIPNFKGLCSADIYPIIPKKNIVSRELLFQIMLSDFFLKQAIKSSMRTGIPKINREDLGMIKVILPTNKEYQQAIVNILSISDSSIEKTEQLIRLKEEYKKGTMQKLLSGAVRFNGFNQMWKNEKIKRIARIKKGEQLNRSKLSNNDEYPALNGGITPSGFTNKWNTKENTVTISEGGNSCGFVNFVTTKFWSGGHCYSLLDVRINSSFLYYALKYREKYIMRLRVGSGLPNIQKTDIEEFLILVPDNIEEQNKIAGVLSFIDKEIDLLKQNVELLKLQKKGLMQQLLTGKTRIKVRGENPSSQKSASAYKGENHAK
jgi:type I restriction enzyme S subunit